MTNTTNICRKWVFAQSDSLSHHAHVSVHHAPHAPGATCTLTHADSTPGPPHTPTTGGGLGQVQRVLIGELGPEVAPNSLKPECALEPDALEWSDSANPSFPKWAKWPRAFEIKEILPV
jgi:hypothetical protein